MTDLFKMIFEFFKNGGVCVGRIPVGSLASAWSVYSQIRVCGVRCPPSALASPSSDSK